VALTNACQRSVRAHSWFYHDNIGSESTVDKSVELTRVVYHVAEPKISTCITKKNEWYRYERINIPV
jgi:hypothetical protein